MFRSWCRCASACTLVLALVFLQSSRLEAQTLRILFTSVDGSTVTIQGENFASVTNITLGTVALENIVVSPAGDMITATLPVAMPNGSHLLTLTSSQSTSPVTCATAAPAPDWVCVGDGWVPAGHPLAVAATPTTTTTTTAFVATIGSIGPQGLQGLQGPPGENGASGATTEPMLGRFLATQIVKGAVLTCAGTSLTASTATCTGAKLNAVDMRLAPAEANLVCQAITGSGFNSASGAGVAGDPHLTWNGTTWTLGTGTTAPMQNINCNR